MFASIAQLRQVPIPGRGIQFLGKLAQSCALQLVQIVFNDALARWGFVGVQIVNLGLA